MTLKRITPEEFKVIAASVDTKIETAEDAVKWAGKVAALSVEYQLEACEKEHKAELYEIAKALGYPQEAIEAPCNILAHAIKDLVANYAALQAEVSASKKEHKAVIREIKEGLEKLIGDNYVWDEDIYKDWQEFWQKYGG